MVVSNETLAAATWWPRVNRSSALHQLQTVVARFAAQWLAGETAWCVALSGGPDSLALVGAATKVLPTTALIVDHGMQPDSDVVATTAQRQAMELGCVGAQVLRVHVGGSGGMEAAARTARYKALDEARGQAPVLLGHTLDDQAETVLLGLGRGSGPRSLAGMQWANPPWFRPLLAVRREHTHQVCRELGVAAWSDPHNRDSRFTRVRLRTEVLPLLEDVLGGGVAEALARTATALREDSAVLDALAQAALRDACASPEIDPEVALDIAAVAELSGALRRRVVRDWLSAGGARGLTDAQIRSVDALITSWRGQGGVALGSDGVYERLFARRCQGRLVLSREPV